MEEEIIINQLRGKNNQGPRSAYCYYLKEEHEKEGIYHAMRLSQDEMKHITAEFIVECADVSDDKLNSMRDVCYGMKKRDDSELIKKLEERGFSILTKSEAKIEN